MGIGTRVGGLGMKLLAIWLVPSCTEKLHSLPLHRTAMTGATHTVHFVMTLG